MCGLSDACGPFFPVATFRWRITFAPEKTDAMKTSLAKTVLAGFCGGLALNTAMFFTFRLIGFGLHGDGILISSPLQSPKLVAVWTQWEPLPLVIQSPFPIIGGLFLFTLFHAFAYRSVSAALPTGFWARCWRLALTLWTAIFIFWEFFTPFNQFGEPLPLLAIEILFWLCIAFAESAAIVGIMERPARSPA